MLQKGCDQVKKGIWPMLWACNHQLALGDQGSNVSEKLVICFGAKMRVVVASLLCLATGDPWIIEQWCSFLFNLAKVVETSFHENKLFLVHLQFFLVKIHSKVWFLSQAVQAKSLFPQSPLFNHSARNPCCASCHSYVPCNKFCPTLLHTYADCWGRQRGNKSLLQNQVH